MVTRVLGYPGYPDTRVRLIRRRSNDEREENRVYGNAGTRVPASAGTRVLGSGSALTAPHPVGYPVSSFEAGMHL